METVQRLPQTCLLLSFLLNSLVGPVTAAASFACMCIIILQIGR